MALVAQGVRPLGEHVGGVGAVGIMAGTAHFFGGRLVGFRQLGNRGLDVGVALKALLAVRQSEETVVQTGMG